MFYSVKANPAPEVLASPARLGSSFDVASPGEIDLCLGARRRPGRISFGNTIKKERDIAYAYEKGVRLFAFDSRGRAEKACRASAPGSRVFCRILVDTEGADWPLSRKFGCSPEMAVELLRPPRRLGLDPYGVSFHVGSQQTDLAQWDNAIGRAATMFSALAETDINLRMINLGGGFPAALPQRRARRSSAYATCGDGRRCTRISATTLPEIIVEPGRSIVGDAGVIQSEVVLISPRTRRTTTRWVYLDVGKFGGLAETMDEAIKYRITDARRRRPERACGAGGSDLRQRRHPLREGRLPPAARPQGGRQGAPALLRRLHDHLLVGRLQRLRPAQGLLHLITSEARCRA